MQNKILNLEPAYLTTNAGNLLNSSITTLTPSGVGFTATQPYILLRHIRLNNRDTASAHVVTLYKGASGASVGGTEFAFDKASIPAQQSVDWYAGPGGARFDSGDYLTSVVDSASIVTINMEGEIGLS